MRLVRVGVVVLIATLSSGAAQAQATAQTTAQVVGQVIDADSKQPIAGARIMLIPARAPAKPPAIALPPNVAGGLTDEQGRFAIDVVAAGRHRISAQKQGYAFEPADAQEIDVTAGQAVTVHIAMRRGGVITGRILDDRGEPLSEIQVMAFRRVAGRGDVPAAGGPAMMTNDLGEYRIAGLVAGEYVLRASVMSMGPFTASPARAGSTWAPTYYPGTAQQAEAQTVTVQHADTVSGLDFRLIRAEGFVVSGIVVDQSGKPVAEAMIMLRMVGDGGSNSFGPALSGRTKPDGTFAIGGVVSGRYSVVATPIVRTAGASATFTAIAGPQRDQLQISVDGANVVGVRIIAPPPTLPQQ